MNCTIIIFGTTGDLARKKLIPALYNLLLNKKLTYCFIVGIGRKQLTATQVLERSRDYINPFDGRIWNKLQRKFYYFRSDFYDQNKFGKLGNLIKSAEREIGLSGNRLFYLATMPEHFDRVVRNIRTYRLAKQKNGWSRAVFEKPFGENLASVQRLNECVRSVFSEDQIFRIDHYLGKELVQNIAIIRFTNTILEPLWNRNYIDHVQIILSENLGIEERGAYYDKYGALKDVVQNHLLQLLCLVAMEPPSRLNGDYIRDEKMKILRSIEEICPKNVILGQYKGYREEKGVSADSRTETFAALKLFIQNARWKDIPFYMITGKAMKNKTSSIYIQFREPPCLLPGGICDFPPNYLVIQIQPEEGFYLQLNGKSPGKMEVVPLRMNFCHKCTFGTQYSGSL